jgi:hypothetical protein
MSSRFKMVLGNSGAMPTSYYNIINAVNISKSIPSRPTPLNAPMVSRIHKAVAGCSACGKKVA